MTLDQLSIDSWAEIQTINEQAPLKKRLQDLGFVSGVDIQCLLEGPLKDPRMYRLLGTSIALRNQEAQHIFVRCDA